MLISSTLPYVPVRSEPSHRSEQLTQMLFGELAGVTNENEEWLEIKLNDDGYSGWIERKVTFIIDNSDILTPLKIVNDPALKVTNGFVVQQIPCGALLHEFSEENHSFTCNLSSFYYENGLETVTDNNALNIVSLAKGFLGTPYLWGGKTFYGIDCSGLVQVVCKAVGKQLPRDASQQINVGQEISHIQSAQSGDLAFFNDPNGAITHVGILLNQMQIIHASGSVRIDTIDDTGIFNMESNSYTHQLNAIRRIF